MTNNDYNNELTKQLSSPKTERRARLLLKDEKCAV